MLRADLALCESHLNYSTLIYRFRALHDCLVTPASPAMRISLTSIRRTVRDTKLPIDSRRSSMYSASSILKSPRRPGPNFIGHIRSRRINGEMHAEQTSDSRRRRAQDGRFCGKCGSPRTFHRDGSNALVIAGWYANRIADRDPPTYDKFGKATNTRMFQGRGTQAAPVAGRQGRRSVRLHSARLVRHSPGSQSR